MKYLAIFLLLVTTACSPIGAAKALLPGKGIGVNTNAQVAKNASQTVGSNTINELELINPVARKVEQSTGDKKVQADSVETVIVQEKDSPWLIIALVLAAVAATAGWLHGWNTPSPREKRLLEAQNVTF